jgi:probable rRNA maturation factor
VGSAARSRSIHVGPWRIDVTERPGVPRPVALVALARAIAAALDAAGAPAPASVGLVLSDDGELAELDLAHLGKAGPTDVLSFPLLAPEDFPPHEGGPAASTTSEAPSAVPDAATPRFVAPPSRRPHLGDVVVSVERAIDQAADGRGGQTGDVHWAPADELRLLVTHGTLHLCGWDHAEPREEAAMRALERRLMGIARAGPGPDPP